MGSIPGLITLLSTKEGPFQLPENDFWQRLVVASLSIGMVGLVSLFFMRFLFKHLVNPKKSSAIISVWTGIIVIVGCIVAVIIGWEFNWLLPKAAGWGGVAELKWIQFVIHVPLFAAAYSFFPALVLGVIGGGFVYLYQR